ncbi:hypothetical protein SNE26_07130 [Mucilaginibacter sp. cycad4]|uniref:hypothetical protein n=1 Tax=Mucilaginibacter sp. cycad4 TaxID=3342096 RepID=UPI002AABE462|nr:hypothetical protein [Mucilaginibacter gossypii]WPV01544.1 hypothetical protein SNE26_07130 [Mucilaginibacter gossypii]
MKITVSKYLNARIGSPSVNATIKTYKSPGDVLSIDAAVIGDDIEGNAIWYHNSEDLCYYWSGGIEEIEFAMATTDIGKKKENTMLLYTEAKGYFWRKFRELYPTINGVGIEHDPIYLLKFQSANLTSVNIPAALYFKGFKINTSIILSTNSIFKSHALGDSISRAKLNEFGSCGIRVKGSATNNSGDYILTNYHVVAPDLLLKKIFNYSADDDTAVLDCNMPSWTKAPNLNNRIGFLYQGQFDEWSDIGIIRLNPGVSLFNTTFNGKKINGHLDVFGDVDYEAKPVVLYGAQSGEKFGIIQSVNASQKFELSGQTYFKDNLIQISNASDHGDSGCPVVLGSKIIGLLIGSDALSSYVIPIQRMLNHFKLKL